MSETEAKWQYAVIGNIIKTHFDKDGIQRYGTKQFKGGTKVYLCGKHLDFDDDWITIDVIGLSRGHRFQAFDVPIHFIENVRCGRVYNPAVLEMMNNMEYYDAWWHDTPEDKAETIEFVRKWNETIPGRSDPESMLKSLRELYKQYPNSAIHELRNSYLPYTEADLKEETEQ